MDDLAALGCATDEFRRWLAAVTTEQWQSPTDCDEWDVTALVTHVVGGNKMAELLLHGADAKQSLAGAEAVAGTDLTAAFESTSAEQIAAFAEDGALDRLTHHVAMDMPGSMLLMFRTLDLGLHGWDLATSIGADATLDPDLVDSIWARVEPIAPMLSASGRFSAPHRDLPADASTQDKLLRATGR
jgi:uncharacterized protein (TIGR03086 family)